jgi:hypothetical protein
MEADQDWCLTCGTAAPGRLGERPGWRAASTVIALTLLLVLGAVAAGYAALTGDSQPKAAAPAPAAAPQTQAQVTPPAASTPPATATTPPAATQTQPATPKKLPKVHAPTSGTAQGSPVTPTPTPTTPATPATPTPTTSTPTTSTPTASTGTTTTPTDTGPQPIDLNGDAGTIYDPYGRVKAGGEATRALDGDTTTSWYVDPKDPQQVAVGYAVDLGKLQGVREIKLQTPTAGFRMEVYATDEAELPPDILDTRWSHITNVSNVGAKDDGKRTIVLGAGTTKYRNVLLWFTQPPTDGPRLRISELELLG